MLKLSLLFRYALVYLVIALILPANLDGESAWTAPGTGHTYVVNSTLDTPASAPESGVCADAQGMCSLRAAVMVANAVSGADTIILPTGVYTLTLTGYDNASLVGDLDISDDLTIQGAGSGDTIIDGNGTVTGDRVFQILNTVLNVTLSGLTIRNGHYALGAISGYIGGGGLYMEGGCRLALSQVVVEGNTAENGGGLYIHLTPAAQAGSLTLDHVIVRNNAALAFPVAGGPAGGTGGGVMVLAPSASNLAVDVSYSQVYGNNAADGSGGGFFVQGADAANWSIRNSEIYANTAAGDSGGIENRLPLSLAFSRITGNHAEGDGGGIFTVSPLSIVGSTLDGNTAVMSGGGISSSPVGSGALYNDFLNISQSTVSGNSSHFGGGIFHGGIFQFNSVLTLTNSTISGNVVYLPPGSDGDGNGGGLYVSFGQAQVFNTTIAFNRVQPGTPGVGPGLGGGVFVSNGVFTAENSIIAQNKSGDGTTLPAANDCYSLGTARVTLDFDLFSTNCFITGPQPSIIIADPLLSPLQFNGGITLTHALLPGSPAIDAGATAGCTGAGGAPITTDQRGLPRIYGPACDIGAYEYIPTASVIFFPFVLR